MSVSAGVYKKKKKGIKPKSGVGKAESYTSKLANITHDLRRAAGTNPSLDTQGSQLPPPFTIETSGDGSLHRFFDLTECGVPGKGRVLLCGGQRAPVRSRMVSMKPVTHVSTLLSQITRRRSDMLALGAGLLQEAADGTLLLVVVLPGEAVDSLGDLVHGLAHAELGVAEAAAGVLADGLAAVLLGVSEGDGEVALELLAVGVGGVGAVHGELGGALGGVVHVGDGEGVAGPLVAVKLDEVCIVFSGESPNNAVRGLHFYTDNTGEFTHFCGGSDTPSPCLRPLTSICY